MFDVGSATLGIVAVMLIIKKGSIWVTKLLDVKAVDVHELTIVLWTHKILSLHWSEASSTKDGCKTKKIFIIC